MIFSVGFVYLLWVLHNFLISNEVIVLGRNVGTLVSITHRFYVLSVVSVIVVVWKCLRPFLIFVTLTALAVMAHAIMRDPKHTDKQSYAGIRHGSEDSDEEEESSGSSPVMVDRPGEGDV